MTMATEWHGTLAESLALNAAVAREFKCDCSHDDEGRIVNPCAGHRWLSSDQRANDGLLFASRISGRLIAEEWRPSRREESS